MDMIVSVPEFTYLIFNLQPFCMHATISSGVYLFIPVFSRFLGKCVEKLCFIGPLYM